MFDAFKDQIWEELGPLNPNWFEELTAKASSWDWGDTEKENPITAISCGQDGSFKTPLGKCPLDGDMFSTPKIFRQRRPQSPETLTEDALFFPDQGTSATVKMDTSPCLFGKSIDRETPSKSYRKRLHGDIFGLLDTPKHSTAHSAKRISESLGAQLDPDMSWTSSLNTPVMSPTIILTKSEERRPMCPVRIATEEQVMFVRKLFPSAKESGSTMLSPEQNDRPLCQHNGLDSHLPGVIDISPGFQDTLPGDSGSHWKQTLPDAIEDGEIRSTMAGVLDGAEDVLSIFFSNRSLALQRVKTKERIKRKQSGATKEHVPTSTMEHDKVSSERAGEYQHTRETSEALESRTDMKSGDLATSQWTPINVPDISDYDMDSFHHEGSSFTKHIIPQDGISETFCDFTGSQQPDRGSSKQTVQVESALSRRTLPCTSQPEGSQLTGSVVESSLEHTFPRKTRTFVYCVQNPLLSVQDKYVTQMLPASPGTAPRGENQNIKQSETIPNEAEFNNLNKIALDGKKPQVQQKSATEENIVSQAPTKDPDLDMSQLCRVFAQDFSQVVDYSQPCSKRADAIKNGFSASACLSAMRLRNRKLLNRLEWGQKPEHLNSGISDEMHIPGSQFSNSANTSRMKSTVCDSSFPPYTLSDVTQTESSNVHPSSEKSYGNQSSRGFITGNNWIISLPPEAIKKAKASLDDLIEENMTNVVTAASEVKPVLSCVTGSRLSTEVKFISPLNVAKRSKQTSVKLNGQVQVQTPQSINVSVSSHPGSGFKMASNKKIHFFSANLEKVKDLFEIEDEIPAVNIPEISLPEEGNMSCGLELVDGSHLPPLPYTHQRSVDSQGPLTASQRADVSELCSLLEAADSQLEFTQFKPAKLNFYVPDGSPPRQSEKELDPDFLTGIDFDDSFNSDVEKQSVKMATTDKNTTISHCKEICQVTTTEIKSSGASSSNSTEKPKEHVIHRRVLYFPSYSSENIAERSFGLLTKTTNENHLLDMDTNTSGMECESKSLPKLGVGFKTAGGNAMIVSEKCLSNARALFADLEEKNCAPKCAVKNTEQVETSPVQYRGEVDTNVDSNVTHFHGPEKKVDLKEPRDEYSDKIKVDFIHSHKHGDGGFHTASGKGVTISAKALQKTNAVFKDCDAMERSGCAAEKLSKTSVSETGCNNFERNNCGFSTARGKRVDVSATCLLKARTLLNDCDELEKSKPGKIPSLNAKILSRNIQQKSDCDFKKPSCKAASISAKIPFTAKTPFDGGTSHEFLGAKRKMLEPENSQTHAKDPLKNGSGFSTASGKRVSVSKRALLKAQALLSECNVDGEELSKSKKKISVDLHTIQNPTQKHSGFKTASVKEVTVSPKAHKQAKAVFNNCDSNMDSLISAEAKHGNIDVKSADGLMNNPGESYCAFITAGGKNVHVSEKGILKAKSILNENLDNCTDSNAIEEAWFSDGRFSLLTEDGTGVKKGARNKSNSSDLNGDDKSCDFSTASGKSVHMSDGALQKAKSILNECDVIENPQPENGHKVHLEKIPTKETHEISHGSTASGEGVFISEKALQHVKSVYVLGETGNVKYSVGSNPVGSRFGFSTASGDGLSVSEKALQEACDDTLDSDTDPHKRSEENRPLKVPTPHINVQRVPVKAVRLEDCEVIQTIVGMACQSSSVECQAESSLLNFESLGFSGCSVTQRRYFAQEAMDCTKALLEDEDLTDHCPGTPIQAIPMSCKGGFEMRSGIGKRSAEDLGMTDQPPLKRRLLTKFDRTVDCSRRSKLTPAKSSSDGIFKDRKVFKYNVALQPNVTRPYRANQRCVDTRLNKTEPQKTTSDPTAEDRKPVSSKTAVFVPPFRKNVKLEPQRSSGLQDKTRAPAVFVSPFRKNNRVTKEGSFKPSEDNHSPFISEMPTKTTSVPLPEYNPITDTGSDNAKESIKEHDPQNIDRTDVGNDGGHCLPVTLGGEDATAEESIAGQLAPDATGTLLDVVYDAECLQLARDMQDMRIRKKKRQTIRPLPGSLYLAKTSGVARLTLREAVGGWHPVQHTHKQLYGYGVHRHVSDISSESAEAFRFVCRHFFRREAFVEGRIQLADGGWLIPRNDGTAGKHEFHRALCDSPGVDPKLISEDWVFNHYRWVVWKRACMERAFPALMGSLCLTPEQVLLQLKYRYDLEVDNSKRSALRKIMERDDTAVKTLVLCVCGVVTKGHNPTRQSWSETKNKTPPESAAGSKAKSSLVGLIWLTDGWYAIKAQLDVPLTAMLHRGRLAIGGKVLVHGAELVGSQYACSPLEAPDSLMLKIGANGTRAARWYTRLGFYSNPSPFLLPLSSLYSNGGPVGCVDIVVLRSYPTQWMEKKSDGGFVFRAGRAEEREARRHGDSKHRAMEILFAKIQAQFEKEEDVCGKPRGRRRTLLGRDIETLLDGEELYDAVENDPVYLEGRLSEQQQEALNSYRRCVGERRQAALQERFRQALESTQEGGSCHNRDVTPIWKLSVADSRAKPGSNAVYLLNIWRPSMDLQSLLKEGCRYRAYQLSTSEGKKRAGNTSIQLTATKKTQFQNLQASAGWLSERFQAREAVGFRVLLNRDLKPLCGEVDLVGYVIAITDRQGHSPVVYLVDGWLDFVKVRCCSSLVQQGLEEVVKPLALVALSNLQLRAHPSSPIHSAIPGLYAGDLVSFSTNPKEPHLQEAAAQLRTLVQGQEHFFRTAEERLCNLVQGSVQCLPPPPWTPGWKADAKPNARTTMTPQQSVRSVGPFTPLNRVVHPPPACSSGGDNKDPKSLKKKRGLDYLCRIPSPPPLCPLGTMTLPLPCVSKNFNTPRRAETHRILKTPLATAPQHVHLPLQDEWVEDEELVMIDTQALHDDIGIDT
ncbi:breast cancer type 2 susceptibility protein isoform X4 [Salmo salar]|uniref:Breast cancer type 2 susceptibility protein isoform X4 n=1 Tax=Salmo salar TaxID=8030 RepID=A0A1S3SX55_SALSA|nr:breast cancer type 2 susceptibility protein isoform X4 [Salmo salar]